jgi:phosphatidate cytidylyltransferase
MLRTRIITALVLLAIILPALFVADRWVFQAIALVALTFAAWEWGRMIAPSQAWWGAAGMAILGSVCGYASHSGLAWANQVMWLACAFWVIYGPLWLMPRRSVKAATVALGVLLLTGTWIAIMILHRIGIWYLISCFLVVWIADTGAYFSGKAFGKHKLAPTISPGKTREGAVGAVLAVGVYMVVTHFFFPQSVTLPNTLFNKFNWLVAMLAAVGLTAFSVIGDLIESKLKRECKVKDSGNTLPGHGGVLDRIDALLPVLPLCALLS